MCTILNGWPGCWKLPDTSGRPTEPTPTSSCSTPARSARTPTTSCTATSATSPRASRPIPICRSPSAAVWRRRTATPSSKRPRGSTSCSAPTTSGPCRRCSTARGTTASPGRNRRGAGGIPVRAARGTRIRIRRMGFDIRRLQQHLHVLHRARAARQGGRPQARRRAGRGAVARRRGRTRGHAARPERERLRGVVRRPRPARDRGVRQAAARLRRIDGLERLCSHRRTPKNSPTT